MKYVYVFVFILEDKPHDVINFYYSYPVEC